MSQTNVPRGPAPIEMLPAVTTNAPDTPKRHEPPATRVMRSPLCTFSVLPRST